MLLTPIPPHLLCSHQPPVYFLFLGVQLCSMARINENIMCLSFSVLFPRAWCLQGPSVGSPTAGGLSLLWPNNIPEQIFFIQPSVDGHQLTEPLRHPQSPCFQSPQCSAWPLKLFLFPFKIILLFLCLCVQNEISPGISHCFRSESESEIVRGTTEAAPTGEYTAPSSRGGCSPLHIILLVV